jgi:hypothetical protein
MLRKYDAIAISLLVFSVVLVTAISIDPKGFALREWQQLIAAILTLGGAGIVYRGATLAYKAAMAKVDLDRETTDRLDKRKRLALYLKIIFATRIMSHEAELLLKRLQKREKTRIFKSTDIRIKIPAAIDEAWNSLDAFPMTISKKLSLIRASFYNFELYSRRDDQKWIIPSIGPDSMAIHLLRQSCEITVETSKEIRIRLNSECNALKERD